MVSDICFSVPYMCLIYAYSHFAVGEVNPSYYTNIQANEQHNGFISFGNSASFKFPLTQKWTDSKLNCVFNEPYTIPLFANNSFYCVSNGPDPYQPPFTEYVTSINPMNGNVNWKKSFPNADFLGMEYISSGYISAYDAYYGYFVIVDVNNNGNVVQNIPIYPNTEFHTDYIAIGITGDNQRNLFYVFWMGFDTDTNKTAGFLAIHPENGILYEINYKDLPNLVITEGCTLPQSPTICGQNNDILILYDLYSTMIAYNISYNNNKFTLNPIWNKKLPLSRGVYLDSPMLSLNKNNQILYNHVATNEWELINVVNGGSIINYTWSDNTIYPVINEDLDIYVYIDTGRVTGYKGGFNQNNSLWTVDSNEYKHAIMVNEFVFLSNDNQQLTVINILNGSQIWNQQFDGGQGLRTTPGLDVNGNPTLIVHKEDVEVADTALYGFQ